MSAILKSISGFLLVLVAVSASAQSPVVKTNSGYIRGVKENGAVVFRGIPYAQPPVNEARYAPPVAHSAWKDTLDVSKFGASAMQPFGAKVLGSEDCLYLNVYTPKADDHKRPVVVWVHGGSMTNGSGNSMNGHAFADRDDIVAITINYRLGALGFLYLGDLEKKYAQSGNLGLLDVVAALKWIHENIVAFGGDPDRVTIMGESAGAKLLSAVMVSPASKGLYQQAILESGSVQCIRDITTAKNERALLLSQLGLGANNAAKLLTLPADTLMNAQGKICAGIGGNSFFGPVTDGVTITGNGYDYATAGKLSDIKILIGTNENEGAAFIKNVPHKDVNAEVLEPLFRANAPMAAAYYQFQLKTDSSYTALVKTLTQYMYQLHAYRFAAALTGAAADVPLWMYRYKYQNGRLLGARHGDELHYIWDAAAILKSKDGAEKKQLANSLHSTWVNFIKTGDPNSSNVPRWPKYSAATKQVMVFDGETKITQLNEVYNDPALPAAVFVIK